MEGNLVFLVALWLLALTLSESVDLLGSSSLIFSFSVSLFPAITQHFLFP